MRILKVFFLFVLTLSLSALAACGGGKRSFETAPSEKQQSAASAPKAQGEKRDTRAEMQRISLKDADRSQSVAEAVERKIIKDAELTLEVNSPLETQRTVSTIAESHGGFVVTSESKQRQAEDPSQRVVDVTLIIRVPSTQFGPARDEILGLTKNVLEKKETGQDVTEEFIDLEARVKTQKALEAQFLEIMKQAHKVEDALEVQRQIAEVRTEIEKLEGRKRFLENRSSLSTITVHLQSPTTIVVATTGFGRDLKEALRDSVDVARAIILFLIRFVIVMIPVFIFIILPFGLLARYFLRRARRIRLARASEMPSPVPSA